MRQPELQQTSGNQKFQRLLFAIVKMKGKCMKISTMAAAAAFAFCGSLAYAQTNPVTPPQPRDTTPSYDTSGKGHSPSGSGTSTSGGKDENGDEGRDKMPQSNMNVKPSPGKPDIPDPSKSR